MKPYLGILIDSFQETVGNKVLWALLIGWTLVLVALAPFGYVSERSFQLSSVDIRDRSELIEKLAKAARGQGSLSAQAVASQMPTPFLKEIQTAVAQQNLRGISASELATALNAAIASVGLYSEDAFPSALRRSRLKPLIAIEPEQLAQEGREELNRELLQLAFPLELNRPRGEQLWIGYAGFRLGDQLQVSRRQIKQFVEPVILTIVIKLGLGVLGVFIAIVVTSSIIPDTFRAGSLHLLLSKPISRVWLYLSKLVGGCTFVLLNITFVLVGIYFIAGFRFGIWNNGLLACIPVLLFVFVIFYSVSGLAGLIWGNSIVCVVACMILWALCFGLGFMHDLLLPQIEVMPQISRIKQIGERLAVVNEKGEFNLWNAEFSVWQPAIKSEQAGRARTYGPFYVAEHEKVLVKSFTRVPFGSPIARSRKLTMVSLSDDNGYNPQSSSSKGVGAEWVLRVPSTESEARETAFWPSNPGPELPTQVFDLLEVGDRIVGICRGGIYELDLDMLDTVQAGEQDLFGIKLPWTGQEAFEKISPQNYFPGENATAASYPDGEGILIFSAGNLDHLAWRGDQLELVRNTQFAGDGMEAALVQVNVDYCVVARDNLPIEILDSELQPIASIALPAGERAKQLAWVPQSNVLSIVTHTGSLLRLDCEQQTWDTFNLPYATACTSVLWLDESRLYLGAKPNQLHLLNWQSGEVVESFVPRATTLDSIFGWGIRPLYTVMPQPKALDNAMGYLLTGSATKSMNALENDLESAQVELDIWTPILSNLAFVALVLTASCVYVSRKEY